MLTADLCRTIHEHHGRMCFGNVRQGIIDSDRPFPPILIVSRRVRLAALPHAHLHASVIGPQLLFSYAAVRVVCQTEIF
jgi:hypothetical protein